MQQDGEAVVRNLKYLREQEFYKKIEAGNKKLMIFCDVGSHFRNRYLAHYFFIELKEAGILVNWNFFSEKHGMLFLIFTILD